MTAMKSLARDVSLSQSSKQVHRMCIINTRRGSWPSSGQTSQRGRSDGSSQVANVEDRTDTSRNKWQIISNRQSGPISSHSDSHFGWAFTDRSTFRLDISIGRISIGLAQPHNAKRCMRCQTRCIHKSTFFDWPSQLAHLNWA